MKVGEKTIIEAKKKANVLWQDKWIQVLDMGGWTIYRHTGTNKGIAILVYRDEPKGFLIRVENVPPHGGMVETSVTGTVELTESLKETCSKELAEETGYSAEPSEFKDLGFIHTSKASDFKLYMFAVDVTGKKQGELTGDGSEGEKGASVKWVDRKYAVTKVSAPSIPTMIARLDYMG